MDAIFLPSGDRLRDPLMQEVSQQRFEESYGFAVLLCYSETNGLRACAFNGHAYLSSFRQLRQLQVPSFATTLPLGSCIPETFLGAKQSAEAL